MNAEAALKTERPAVASIATESRQFLKYTFFKVRPEWRRLASAERSAGKTALRAILEQPPGGMTLRTYSLTGIRGDADFALWSISPDLESLQRLIASVLATPLGGYLDIPYSYLAMTQKSQYLGDHRHAEQEGTRHEPKGRRFLFVYPFTKKREWYALPFDERQRIMGSHFRTGHKYPNIKIHTGYSFGLDDQEFVLAFEGDDPGEFLDLVQELRPTEASKYTALETPIFTCVAASPEELVEQWGG